MKIKMLHMWGHDQNDEKFIKHKITENFYYHYFLSTLECRAVVMIKVKYEFAKMYGDSILDAHANCNTSAKRLHVRNVGILRIRDSLLSHDN